MVMIPRQQVIHVQSTLDPRLFGPTDVDVLLNDSPRRKRDGHRRQTARRTLSVTSLWSLRIL